MRYIKEWTAKKNLNPGDIPVIQRSTFQCSVWGGGRRNHTESWKQGKIQSNIRGGEEHHGLLMQMLRQHCGLLGITLEPDSVKTQLQSNTFGGGSGLLVETADSAAAHSEDLGQAHKAHESLQA